MNEQEWLEWADPTPMLEFLRGKMSKSTNYGCSRSHVAGSYRLFGVLYSRRRLRRRSGMRMGKGSRLFSGNSERMCDQQDIHWPRLVPIR